MRFIVALDRQCVSASFGLTSTRVVSQEKELRRVAVPAPFNKAWLDTKLAGKVARALQKIYYTTIGAGVSRG